MTENVGNMVKKGGRKAKVINIFPQLVCVLLFVSLE